MPRLVLFLIVDQARFDYLVRFGDLYSGGLRRILDHGAFFTEARYDHAQTLTAPGHATLVSGRHPSRTGIVGNDWFDKERRSGVNSVQDGSFGRSPNNFIGTGLGDWLKEADPRSRVFGAGPKDRSAILLGGHRADGAWWYSTGTGEWVTSRYYDEIYGDAEPGWVEGFHDRELLLPLFGSLWEPLPVDDAVLRAAGIERVDRGAFEWGFPYAIGDESILPGPSFYRAIYDTPFIDRYLLWFAEALIEAEALGQDGSTDFLGLAPSALDAVGHDYGPDSREVLDTLLRLDAALGDFLSWLDGAVGMENVLLVMSADHGVVPLPEVRWMHDEDGRRVGTQEALCFQRAGAAIERRFGEGDWILRGLYLNDDELERRGVDRATFEAELADQLRRCPGVDKVFTRTQMLSAEPPDDPDFRLFCNSYYPGRSPDLMVQWAPFIVDQSAPGTTHGTAHEYDRHVPWIVLGRDIAPVKIDTPVSIVDVAPTVAGLVGITPLDELDGVDRSQLLRAGTRR